MAKGHPHDVILNVLIRNEEAVKQIKVHREGIESLVREQHFLNQQFDNGQLTSAQYTSALVTNRLAILSEENAIIRLRREIELNDRSTHGLKMRVNELKQQYSNLTDVQKQTKEGMMLANELHKESLALEQSKEYFGSYTNKLKSYSDSIKEATGLNTSFGKTLTNIGIEVQATSGFIPKLKTVFSASFTQMGQSAKAFGTALKSLAANPIGAVLMVIVTVFDLLKKAFSQNTEATEKINAAMEKLSAVFDIVLDAIVSYLEFFLDIYLGMLDVVLVGIEKIAEGLSWLFDLVGWESGKKAMDDFGNSVNNIREGTDKATESKKKLTAAEEKYQASLKKSEKANDDLIKKEEEYHRLKVAASNGDADAKKKLALAEDEYEKAKKKSSEASIQLSKDEKNVTDRQKEYNEVIRASGDYADELEMKQNNLTKAQDEFNRSQGNYKRQCEDLTDIINDQSKTEAERIDAAEQLGVAMKLNLEQELALAEEAVAIANLRREKEGDVKDVLDEQAAAMDKMINLQRALDKVDAQTQKTIKGVKSSRRGSSGPSPADIKKKEQEAVRALEDSNLKMMEEGLAKQEETTRLAYKRQIEDLQERLDKEKKLLSPKAKQAILDTIANLEKQQIDDLNKLKSENFEAEAAKTRERLENEIEMLQYANKDKIVAAEEAMALRLQLLEQEKAEELRIAEEKGFDVSLIEAKYNKLRADEAQKLEDEKKQIKQDAENKKIEDERLAMEARIKELIEEGKSRKDAELAALIEKRDALTQYENETDAEFKARQDASNAEVIQKNDEIFQAKMDAISAELTANDSLYGSIKGMMTEMAGNSEAMAIFSKAQTLAEIGINTAKALSAGVASAQSVGFPANIAAVATTVSTILANVAKAKKALSSQKTEKAPKFATGGLVVGEGSGTSDSINARLSNGESVITALGTQMFGPMLSAFNQIGGGAPIVSSNVSQQMMGQEMLTEAFQRALQSMPSPVVSVQEINDTNKRVEVLEAYGTL